MMLEILRKYARSLYEKSSLVGEASPEDQLKEPVAGLIHKFGKQWEIDTSHSTEVSLREHKVRPDIAIYVENLICGYIELKAPGLGADAPKLKGKHNKQQWEKLKSLPNLIYTDGRDWALYRNGKRQGGIVRLDDAPQERDAQPPSQRNADDLGRLLKNFLRWSPIVPHSPTRFAQYLAPLTRFLRDEVEAALGTKGSNVKLLANEWRQYFFPEADNAQFADAYAQTVTYAMLLARLSGAKVLDPEEAARALNKNSDTSNSDNDALSKNSGLLAEVLKLLGQERARKELQTGFELLRRSMEALDPSEFLKTKPDLWLYFYEDFLAAYDKKLRNDYGVYYTPREVVDLQVRLAAELLETRFGKKQGFADDGVVFLDPAVGTGTYLVAAVRHALEKVRARSGKGAVAGRARQMARNMYGFEVLVGPYAVAHLRLTQVLTQALREEDAALQERLRIYLADTLGSPYATPPGGLSLTHKALTDEHNAARKMKQQGDILVCLGNPPYDRQQIAEGDDTTQRKGGWVRFGDQIKGGAKQEEQGERPILADFTEPASNAGAGKYIVNLYNDYVYFWRWALWRLFEQQECGGVVTFITASSYLAGPGFVGMREVMRRTFDELWILDLGGDSLGTRKTPNVFNIRTPVAIAIGVRGKDPSPETPARVHYARIVGDSREAKLMQLAKTESFAALDWTECPDDWHVPLLPVGHGRFFEWPRLSDIFPLTLPGAKFHRSWPIGETTSILRKRWRKLVSTPLSERAKLFRETSDWKISKRVADGLPGEGQPSISECTRENAILEPIRYAYRSFDRHYALYDFRLGDRLRPTLSRLRGKGKQVFFCTKFSFSLSHGQAMVASAHIPDLDHFHGRGGKDVIPLYRDAEARQPNVTRGLLEILSTRYGMVISAEDLAAYVYALLGGQSYTKTFWNELETPGPRVPVTQDADAFAEAAALGRRLIWLHTYAERFRDENRGNIIPPGTAKCTRAISDDAANYPEKFSYDASTKEILVGDGRFGPVDPAVWEFEVSGLRVVKSWLGYRMKVRAGRKSSPLDDIRPERWTPALTDELLELLWVLEATLAMEPELAGVLAGIVRGDCYMACELPTPMDSERHPPRPKKNAKDQKDLL